MTHDMYDTARPQSTIVLIVVAAPDRPYPLPPALRPVWTTYTLGTVFFFFFFVVPRILDISHFSLDTVDRPRRAHGAADRSRVLGLLGGFVRLTPARSQG
jgi:hypothetical protein